MNREFNCTVKTRIEKFHPHFYLMSKKYFQCTSLVVLDSPIKTHYDTECRTYYADNRLSANLPESLSEAQPKYSIREINFRLFLFQKCENRNLCHACSLKLLIRLSFI